MAATIYGRYIFNTDSINAASRRFIYYSRTFMHILLCFRICNEKSNALRIDETSSALPILLRYINEFETDPAWKRVLRARAVARKPSFFILDKINRENRHTDIGIIYLYLYVCTTNNHSLDLKHMLFMYYIHTHRRPTEVRIDRLIIIRFDVSKLYDDSCTRRKSLKT